MDLLIIADDLTGAADCAIPFVPNGQRTVVSLQPLGLDHPGPGSVTLAVDADTRRLGSAEAAQRTRAIFTAHGRAGRRLYKKIDSTLRGNWAAEVAALRPLAGLAIVAPAYPAVGRTVRGGEVYVHGCTLADTELWRLEHRHRPAAIGAQLREAGLTTEALDADLLRDPQALAARIADLASRGIDALVVDAGTEHALRSLAVATMASEMATFWVGSGGLAREIAALQPMQRASNAAGLQPSPGPTLVLAGSLSAATDRQCAVLRDSGPVRELVVPPSLLRQGPAHAPWHDLQASIGSQLAAGADLLLRIGREEALDPSEGAHLASALARLVGPHFGSVGALIATGGETARAMLVEAQIDSLELVAELQAGVAAGIPCQARAHRPTILTKAGGFGDDQALYAAWSRLRRPDPGMTP